MKFFALYPLLFLFCFHADAKTVLPGKNIFSGKQPLLFIENKGQIKDSNIRFIIKTPELYISVGKAAIHYHWFKEEKKGAGTLSYRMDMILQGADPAAELVKEDMQEYYERYYSSTEILAHSYGKITYKNVYPGIDWVLYLKDSKLEYDFVIHPGADAKTIKMRYEGAASLQLSGKDLLVKTPFGEIKEHAPYSYKQRSGKEIQSSFLLRDNILGFEAPLCRETIIIDPVVEWGTYIGGSSTESLAGIETDDNGNIYLVGYTSSPDNIATAGAFQDTIVTGYGSFIVKFNSSGQKIWGTYFGDYQTSLTSLACDLSGNIYVAGYTLSPTGIHTKGAYDTTLNDQDGILQKFDSTGKRIYGTYYGGLSIDYSAKVTCDWSGNVILCGTTRSTTGIASGPDVHAPVRIGTYESGFIAKFNDTGARLWGTYYGGDNTQFDFVKTDTSGNIYLGGYTSADTGIHTPGAYDTTRDSFSADGFLAKFSAQGAIQWGTYYGGNGYDYIHTASGVKDGYIYIAGETNSDSLIAYNAVHKASRGDDVMDGFVAKMDVNNGYPIWATYFGGKANDGINVVSLNDDNTVTIAGITSSMSGIAMPNGFLPYRPSSSGADGFLALMTIHEGRQVYGTYYGGTAYDNIMGIATADDGIYIAGITGSMESIATQGAYQDSLKGPSDCFLAKLAEDGMYIENIAFDSALCPGDSFRVVFNTKQKFIPNTLIQVILSSIEGFPAAYAVGRQLSDTGGVISCKIPPSITKAGQYLLTLSITDPAYTGKDYADINLHENPIILSLLANTPICENTLLWLDADMFNNDGHYTWTGPAGFQSGFKGAYIPSARPENSGRYFLQAELNGCYAKDSIDVVVYPKTAVFHPWHSYPVCKGDPFQLKASDADFPGYRYYWIGPNGISAEGREMSFDSADFYMSGLYKVYFDMEGCDYDTISVDVSRHHNLYASSNTPAKEGRILYMTVVPDIPGVEYIWSGPHNYASYGARVSYEHVPLEAAGQYIVRATDRGCVSYDTVDVEISRTRNLFSVAPNPATNSITIKGFAVAEQIIPLTIVNSLGQIVYNGEISTSSLVFNKTIDLGHLPGGIYILRLTLDDKMYTRQLQLQR